MLQEIIKLPAFNKAAFSYELVRFKLSASQKICKFYVNSEQILCIPHFAATCPAHPDSLPCHCLHSTRWHAWNLVCNIIINCALHPSLVAVFPSAFTKPRCPTSMEFSRILRSLSSSYMETYRSLPWSQQPTTSRSLCWARLIHSASPISCF